ncbi:hypothetical protein [Bradyrhizobium sp. SZCCHNR2020]|uniref:hypothetical protein n=1 Tax=unclassified Bradyrhizobium TaxID=2631580 RepID=UPI0039675976
MTGEVDDPAIGRSLPIISTGLESQQNGRDAIWLEQLVNQTRGVLATIDCRGSATTGQCLDAARRSYPGRTFA